MTNENNAEERSADVSDIADRFTFDTSNGNTPLLHSTRLRHSRSKNSTPLLTPAMIKVSNATPEVNSTAYVVTQLSFTTVVAVADGQQAAGHGSVVMVSMTQSGTMQVDGGGGQFRDLVEVIVGQYGCADVLMVMFTALTVVMVLRLVVVYVVGVGVQMAREGVKRAVVLEGRARRLEV